MSFRVPQSQQCLEEESFWQIWPRRTRSAKKQAQGKVLHSVDFIRTNFMSFPDAPYWLFYKHHKHWPLLALMCLIKILCKLAMNRWMMFLLYRCICLRLLNMETVKWASLFQEFSCIWVDLRNVFPVPFSIVFAQPRIICYNMSLALWRRIWKY